jgi:parallel beta-helix repeat protein
MLPSAAAELSVGQVLGNYEILGTLARGAMSVTYRGRDRRNDERVCIAEYRPADLAAQPTAAKRTQAGTDADRRLEFASRLSLFRTVGEALSAIRHPNLLRVDGLLEANGTAYLISEFVDGETLEQHLRQRQDPVDAVELCGWLLSLLDALEQFHRWGLIHRDVKPTNILVRSNGSAVLVDFSAAGPAEFSADPAQRSLLTSGYAAPEQYLKNGREGPWTDLYGMAAVAYRVVVGRPPPDALERTRTDTLAAATDRGEGRYPRTLLEGIDCALAIDPRLRPVSAEEWRESIEEAIGPTPVALAATAATGQASPPGPSPASKASAGPPAAATKATAHSAADDDDLPPTIAWKRVPAAATGDHAGVVPGDRRPASVVETRPAPGNRLSVLAVLGVLAIAAIAAGGWFGWQLYLTEFKSEWIVDAAGGGDAATIGEALRRARDGATIKIRPGTYAETLALDRPLHLVGDGPMAGIVVAAPAGRPCVLATAEGGSVRGLSLRTESPGESPPQPCIDIPSGAVIVDGNLIGGDGAPAVRIAGTAHPTLRRNHLTAKSASGLMIEGGALAIVADNDFVDTGKAGIVVRGDAAPRIDGNRIRGSGQAGILVSGEAEGTFEENVVAASGLAAVEVRGGAEPSFVRNQLTDSKQAGVFVHDGGRGYFEINSIAGSGGSGVVIGPGGGPTLVDNRIERNGEHGILVLDGGKGRLESNVIQANGGHGLAVGLGARPELIDNILIGNREPQMVKGRVPSP